MKPQEMAARRLAHMTAIMEISPTFFRGWRQYFEVQAAELAETDPDEFSQLPAMLAEEVARLRLKHSPSQRPERDIPSTSPARTRS